MWNIDFVPWKKNRPYMVLDLMVVVIVVVVGVVTGQ
jgi:hypothetical protein